MSKCLFVTATGTDVGKTYISALLMKKLQKLKLNCTYYKPVLSGAFYENDELILGDCRYVVEQANLDIKPVECSTFYFEEMISPHLAAMRKGVEISSEKILEDFEKKKSEFEYIVIEGAGGITCPLNMDKNYLMNDLISEMGVKTLIVADAGLGTLNYVLLTVEYAKNHGIEVAGIVLDNYDKKNFMHLDNKIFIEKLTDIKVVATVAKDEQELKISEKSLLEMFGEV